MTDPTGVVYMTTEGLQKLQDELEQLKTVRLPEVHERLETAISYGELDENAAYDTAKQELDLVMERIADLEYTLRHAEVIDESGPADQVRLGSTVTIVEEGGDEAETYRIVSAPEADPTRNMISAESPIAGALLGRRLGELVVAQTPGGEMRLRIQVIT